MEPNPPAPSRPKLSWAKLLILACVLALSGFVISFGWLQRSKARDTGVRLEMLKGLLEAYKTDNGKYPEPVEWDRRDNAGKWPIGGGATIYQALTGDGTSEIRGFQARAGQQAGPSTGEFGSSGTEIYFRDPGKSKETYFVNFGQVYSVVDAYKHPFCYRRYDKIHDAKFKNKQTFDLWSYGPLESPDASDEAKKAWIKNWD